MPTYSYACTECDNRFDAVQAFTDDTLTTCPECNKESYSKQLSAAGFQLKGSGWYATDFKGGSKPAASPPCQTGEGSCSSCVAS